MDGGRWGHFFFSGFISFHLLNSHLPMTPFYWNVPSLSPPKFLDIHIKPARSIGIDKLGPVRKKREKILPSLIYDVLMTRPPPVSDCLCSKVISLSCLSCPHPFLFNFAAKLERSYFNKLFVHLFYY